MLSYNYYGEFVINNNICADYVEPTRFVLGAEIRL